MKWYKMLCNVMLCNGIKCYVMQFCVMFCNVRQCYVMKCNVSNVMNVMYYHVI